MIIKFQDFKIRAQTSILVCPLGSMPPCREVPWEEFDTVAGTITVAGESHPLTDFNIFFRQDVIEKLKP